MLQHHIQKSIIYALALQSPQRFSDLKPADLDNKLFDYHLKIVMRLGLVVKNEAGLYILTAQGKTLGVHVFSEIDMTFRRARPELLLAVSHNEKWLVYKRNTDPLRNYVGFMHCEPQAGIAIKIQAEQHLLKNCGLRATFQIVGGGMLTTYVNQEQESFINITVLTAKTTTSQLNISDSFAEYFWLAESEFEQQLLLPSMPELIAHISAGKPFYIDSVYQL